MRGRNLPGSVRNTSRDMRRRLLKRSLWPPLYEAEVRMWVPKEKEMKMRKVAFLLPHEILHVLSEMGKFGVMVCTEGLDTYNARRHSQIFKKMETPFVSLSLWGDGVPYSSSS